jgi:hypothetical protein
MTPSDSEMNRIFIFRSLKISNGPAKNVQLANFVIAWNVLQHFYPYFDVVKVDWEQALTDALKQSLKDHTTDQFVQTMKQMLEKTCDGHSDMYGPMNGNPYFTFTRYLHIGYRSNYNFWFRFPAFKPRLFRLWC